MHCHQCGKKFFSLNDRIIHENETHKEEKPQITKEIPKISAAIDIPRPSGLICLFCDRTFEDQQTLNEHFILHRLTRF